MIKVNLAAAAAFAISLAGTASALEHEVLLGEGSFFPQTTYLAPGDTVIFINASDGDAAAKAGDESWTTGTLAMDESFTMVVTTETTLDFVLEASSTATEGTEVGMGAFSFDPAPLD